MFHIIVAFDDTVNDDIVAWRYIVKAALFFLFGYQVYFGMHSKDEETPHLHGHLAVNSVNYRNGSMMITDIIIPLLKTHIEKITEQDCTVIYEDKKNS